jgi:hypothetical protein
MQPQNSIMFLVIHIEISAGGVLSYCGEPGCAGRGGQPVGQVWHTALQASQSR